MDSHSTPWKHEQAEGWRSPAAGGRSCPHPQRVSAAAAAPVQQEADNESHYAVAMLLSWYANDWVQIVLQLHESKSLQRSVSEA